MTLMKKKGGGGRLLLTRNPFGVRELAPVFPSSTRSQRSPSIESRLGRRRGRTDRRAGSLFKCMYGINGQVFKSFRQPAGPAHLHPIDLGGRAEAEVNAHITIRDVAGPAAHLVNERARTRFHRNLRADAVAIGFAAARLGRKRRSNRPERDPMIAIANVVHQQHWWCV